ncbi:hypothetical protein GUJ93_ZPchr0011g27211 [Zizania palustris]|uniref:Uncharacterized protein n=1 Tax=Zizania palustris TaxID=103762 RepID=A0A8J5WGM0_ZIZPA|nr:hypothetical protein GUJ93_ZPchr0011g27383 [Zizania palustris]KAG8089782.1 hypothetical protein GUJ93_ZPchr0011g27211 [Zizania palustris]
MHAMKLQTQQLLFFATAAALVLVAKSHGGGMDVVVVGGSGGGAFQQGAWQAAMLPMHALHRVAGRVEEDAVSLEEQEEEAAFPRRRVLYGNEYAGYNSLRASNAACYGPCPGRGQPYSGRGCQSIYGCSSGR